MMTMPPHSFWRLFAIAALALAMGACGSIDYNFNGKNFFAPSSKKKDIGVVYFHFNGSSEPYSVHARRVKGGYAVQSAIYENDDGDNIQFIASRTKSQKGFIGIQGMFSF
ncbi:MAG: hypothetical protein ACOYNL_08210 [Rickettsiales bacterium]